ncbi:MAG: hypothetical protein IPL23_25650 [Saprospiraceae bacterium]|nr:hypothetical protein [Saprospiraceae bacterium]
MLGGRRNNLIFQFLTETFLLTIGAVFISAILIQPIFALFSDFFCKIYFSIIWILRYCPFCYCW